jgi:hypothetical protein
MFRVIFLAREAHSYAYCAPTDRLDVARREALDLHRSGCTVWISDGARDVLFRPLPSDRAGRKRRA